jgi:glycosyltransferase involved in cell wall biosynthesis
MTKIDEGVEQHMKILYTTALTSPLKSVIQGEDYITALPGFYYPMKMLMEAGHEVNFIVLANKMPEINIKISWFRKENIKRIVLYPKRTKKSKKYLSKVKAYLIFAISVYKELKKGNYDFVYYKATEAIVAQWIANRLKVPVGVRWFGDNISPEIAKYGSILAALKHPKDYIGFRSKCNFFLITDDNPGAGHKYKAWVPKKNPYELLIWKTGIEFKELNELILTIPVPSEPYILYAARFDPWKRQDRVVNILYRLHQNGYSIHLYFAGAYQLPDYLELINEKVAGYKLTDYVHFFGAIPQDDLRNLAHYAVANPFMYDGMNLGNVFYEVMSMGGVVVSLDDGSLNEYIVNNKNGYLVKDEDEASYVISEIIKAPDEVKSIRKNAYITSREKFMSAEERFGNEMKLIESYSKKTSPISIGPNISAKP